MRVKYILFTDIRFIGTIGYSIFKYSKCCTGRYLPWYTECYFIGGSTYTSRAIGIPSRAPLAMGQSVFCDQTIDAIYVVIYELHLCR